MVIKWSYIVALHELQQVLRMKLGNKLTSTHIKFKNSVMKVKYAVQVLSSSVADAIDFLRSIGLPDFQGSEATVVFLRKIDRIFDFLNSRSLFGKGYKKPITLRNLKFFKEESLNWISYLLQLRTKDGTPLYLSPRKNFVIAFCTSIKSILTIAESLLQLPFYTHVLTYKFSQDLLELFFGMIRLRFGCNNNPSSYQFYFALKTLLLKNDITPTHLGNCLLFAVPQELTFVYGDFRANKKNSTSFETTTTLEKELEEEFLLEFFRDNNVIPYEKLKDYILYYISGFVVRKLIKDLNCSCKKALLKPYTSDHNNYCISDTYERFVQFKNRGGLVWASEDVYNIIKECERYVLLDSTNFKSLKSSKIILRVQKEVLESNSAFKDFTCDDDEALNSHKLLLIKRICGFYLKIRIHSLVAWENSKKISSRKRLAKTILFNND